MTNNDLLLAHSLYSNKGVFALLVGAGISKASGIPTGWDVTLDLIRRIAALHKQCCGDYPEKWYVEFFKKAPDYSDILEELSTTQEERVNILRPYFEPTEEQLEEGLKQPTIAHRKIAQLIKKGYIRVVVTTNFDRLLENALREIGIEPTVISNPGHVENSIPLIHSKISIVKINGDYLDTQFLNIKSELLEYDARMESLVRFIFENFGLISIGWSSRWDLALVNIFKTSNKFRYANFFTFMDNCNPELKELSDFRKGQLIKIKDADTFCSELHENIEGLELNEIHPLNKVVSIARLKKYLTKEEYIIQLNDLITNQLDDTYHRLNNELNLLQPNNETVKSTLDRYTIQCDTITDLLITGIYWGKEIHDDIWVRIVIQLAYPKGQPSGYTTWARLVYLPALYLFYAIGLTATLKKNFRLLKKLLELEKYSQYNHKKESLLYDVNSHIVIDSKILNQVIGKNHIVPMNEMLYANFRPKFDKLVITDLEFDDLFDYFEIITALYYIKIFGKGIFPFGRFVYRKYPTNIINTKLVEFKEEQDLFELIQSGIFSDFNELLGCYSHLMERTNQSNF